MTLLASEIRASRVRPFDGGLELTLHVVLPDRLETAVARLSPSGEVTDIFFGNRAWSNDLDLAEPLQRRRDVVGQVARKAVEFSLVLRAAGAQRRAA